MIKGGNTEGVGTKCLMLLAIIIILITMIHHKDGFKGGNSGKVIELDESNFDDTLGKKDIVIFIMFYAPWCPHCTNIMGTLDELAKEVKDEKNVKVVKVDADKHKNISKRENISGFPTLKLYKNGKEIEHYKGQRNVNSMKQFIKNYT